MYINTYILDNISSEYLLVLPFDDQECIDNHSVHSRLEDIIAIEIRMVRCVLQYFLQRNFCYMEGDRFIGKKEFRNKIDICYMNCFHFALHRTVNTVVHCVYGCVQ